MKLKPFKYTAIIHNIATGSDYRIRKAVYAADWAEAQSMLKGYGYEAQVRGNGELVYVKNHS